MKLSIAEKLRRFYDQFSGEDRVLIIINADPDAIASAMAIKRLLWRKTAGVTISNINIIQRPDNIAMIELLGVTLTHVDAIKDGQYNRFVIVDSQPDHHPAFARFSPLHVVIDHHPVTDVKAAFCRYPAVLRGNRQYPDRISPGRRHQAIVQAGHGPVSCHKDRYQQF